MYSPGIQPSPVIRRGAPTFYPRLYNIPYSSLIMVMLFSLYGVHSCDGSPSGLWEKLLVCCGAHNCSSCKTITSEIRIDRVPVPLRALNIRIDRVPMPLRGPKPGKACVAGKQQPPEPHPFGAAECLRQDDYCPVLSMCIPGFMVTYP